jgi:D-lactate dehydrogenase
MKSYLGRDAMALSPIFITSLCHLLPKERILTDPGECLTYGYDNSKEFAMPEVVVFPTTHEEVLAIVKLCYQENIPLVARGRGTSTTGSAVPIQHGLVLSTEKMDTILKVDPTNRVIVTQTGVTNQAIQLAAEKHGFMWAPDPTSSAYCSVGGNLAVNAAGPRAVKYGTTHENTLGLRVVTGDGRDFYTGVYTTKGVVGYDLTRLIIGSEGTLAVITEATLKLTPLTESKTTLQACYDSIEAGAQAVSAIMAQPITPCALEFMDQRAIELVRAQGINLPDKAAALLLIDIDGPQAALLEMTEAIQKAASITGLLQIHIAHNKEEAAQIWASRKALSPTLRKIAPCKINEDIVVPVSRLPELIINLEKLSLKFNIPIVNFGHAGNGNIHVNLLFNTEQKESAMLCLSEVFYLVLSLDGTLSGEHGIGLLKQQYIAREINPVALELMRKIKAQFDPKGILNPGKLFSIV